MTAIWEPVWASLRQHCNSFATMSDHAVFSDIFCTDMFTLSTVCVMTGVKTTFSYPTDFPIDLYIMWQYNCKEDKYICALHNFCERDSQKFLKLCLWGYITEYCCTLLWFVSKALWWHLNVATFCSASNIFIIRTVIELYWLINFFPLTMDVLGQNYTLKVWSFYSGYKSWHSVGLYWWYLSQSKHTPHFKIFYIIILVVVFLLYSESHQLKLATIIHTQILQPVKLRHKT